MATEADVPEAISIVEGVDRSLKIEKLDRTDDECSPGTLNGSKGDLDQHPEIHLEKPFANGGNVQGECSMKVENKNNSFGISEGEHFSDPLSKISQDEQSNQAGMETLKNEVQLQKGTQVGEPVEETVTEENEVIEERKEKLAQEFENHDVKGAGIISEITKTGDVNLEVEEVEASTNDTTVDQVIPNQKESIEDVQCVEKEADIKGADKDGNAESYHKEASDQLEVTTFQEYEASVTTHDVTNRSFKKDNELETNVTSTDEEDSEQTLQTYEPKEEVQKFPEVTPEGAKPESEVAEVITCTEDERTIQNSPEYAEKEDANPVHCPKQDDTITEEQVSMATSTEQETAEHALLEIHAAENHPQEFNEEKSRDVQASVEAAHLSTDTDGKNLEEQALQEKSSSVVEVETTQQISREEEVHTTNLKEEKEADSKCEEPIEVADTTREIEFETIEQRSETNKDLYVPIPEEKADAEDSTTAFVEDNSFLSEVSEVKTKEIIQEDHPSVSDHDLVSGEVSQVPALEEAEAENKEPLNSTPEEAAETVLETEDHAEAGENYNSETMDKEIQTKEDEGERDLKEIKEENKEPVDNAGNAPAEGLTTISMDQPALHIEDIELQAEENVNSKDKLEEKIQTAADEGENGLIEAQTDKYEQAKDTDIASEEKDPEITLTDETALDVKDIDVQAEKYYSSEENFEKQAQVVADEGDTGLKEAEEENKEQVKITDSNPEEKVTSLTEERALDSEETELQVEESVSSKDYLEGPTVEKGQAELKELKEESKELVSINDISPEEKGLATILTDETIQEAEGIDVTTQEYINSKDTESEISCSAEPQEENKDKVTYTDISPEEKIVNSREEVEEQVPVAAYEGDTSLNEAEEENKEQIKRKDTSPEEKALPIISTDEIALNSNEIESQLEENINSTDNLEKQILTGAEEPEHGLVEAEEENKEQVTITDITPEEKGVATILKDEVSLETEDTNLQAEESANSNKNLEEEISAAPELGDTCFKKEDEVDNKEQVESNDNSHEERGLATILTEETSQEIEYADEQEGENFTSEDILEKQIPTAVHEGETDLKEVEAENKEQVENTEIAPEENSSATILMDETAEGVELINVPVEEIKSKEVLEKQILTASVEGETDLKEAEADIKEQVETTYIAPEKKGVETIINDERTVDLEDVHVQEQENFNYENLECQIPTTVREGETDLIEGEAENKKQVKSTDIAAEEKDTTTILRDETAVAIQDVDVQAEEKPEEASEGEEKVGILDDIPVDVHNTGMLEEATVGQSYQVPSHEKAEPKIAVEDEKSEDYPERNHMIVEEVLDKPKITSREFIEEQIIEGNVTSSIPELIEEQTVKSSKDNDTEIIELKEEGSCTENKKEENASDLTREYTLEDATEQIKDKDYNVVKSENENVENLRTTEVDESTTCEKKNAERSEENLSTLPVEYDEVQQGEGSSPAPTEALKEENIIEDTLSVQVAKDVGDNVAATITERSAEVDDSSEVLQKYEPEEEITTLQGVKPEETTPEPSSENVEVTCTREEIQESLDTEMDTKESDPSSAEVLETTIKEALPEVYPIDNTAETATEYQACIEGVELSTEGEKENSEEQTTQEVTSSLIADESEESSKEQEEKTGGHIECEDLIEEAKSETLEKTTEPKPTSEEESNKSLVEDNSFSLEASEKEIEKEIQGEYSSTARSFDSEVVSNQTGLTEATAEDKEQVETTQIAPEEKDNEGTDVYKTELTGETIVEPSSQVQTLEKEAARKLEVKDETDKSDDLAEKNNKICEEVLEEPKITDRDFNEEQITEGNVTNLTTEPVGEQETVKDYQGEEKETEKLNEEGSCIENVNEGNAKDISTESAPEDKDEKLKECIEEAVESKEQITEGNVKTYTPESIEEDTVQNSQDFEKESIQLKEEETCTKNIKEENASEISPEYKVDELKSEEEILENSQTMGVDESSTCETVNVQRSEETFSTLPVVQLLLQKQVQDNIDGDTFSVQETKDGDDGAVTVTETSAEEPSNDHEDGSTLVLQKSEPEDGLTESRDVLPEEMKPESSSENAEVVTCTKEETQESLDIEKDPKESDTSMGQACIEAAELSIEEVSSSPIGEETTEESSKEKYEQKNEAHEECKEAIEGTQEESNKTLVEDGSISLEALEELIEKVQGQYSSIIRSFDSEIENDERDLTEPTEQVEATYIAPEEKDTEGTDVYNANLVREAIVETSPPVQTHEEEAEQILKVEDETDKSDDHPEKSGKICEEVLDEPKIIDRDSCASESVEEETVKDDQAEQKERASSNEEGSSIENIKEGNVSDISNECVPEVIVEEGTGEAVESKEEILQESQKDDRNEDTLPVKEAGENDDYDGTVVLPEAGAEVASIGEESSEIRQIVELGEERAQVEVSDVADGIEVCDLEDKVSVAERTEEETKEVDVPSLALEKLDSDAPEEETTESSEVVPESDFKSIDIVAQDEVIADQTLNEETTKEPSTLLSEEKELRDSEDAQVKEVEVPTEAYIGDLLVARSAEETCLPKEESRELKVSKLVLEKLDAGETEQETKENFETVYKSDSQSIALVCEDEIVTDQIQCEGEKELEASELVQNIEEESPKEVEMPAEEDKQESFAATPSETCLHAEEPIDTELALHKLDAGETEEGIKGTFETVTTADSQSVVVASGDEIIADQTLCEEVTNTPLSTARELGASELALEKLDAEDTEEIKEGPEIVPKIDSGIIEVVSNEEIMKEQIQSPASTLLPEEKEKETSEPEHEITAQGKSTEPDCKKEVEAAADEETQVLLAAKPVEEACSQKEEPSELYVSDSTSDFPSIVVDQKEEITVDETLNKGVTDIPLEIPSYTSLNEEKEPKASELDLQKLDADIPEEVKGSEVIPQFVSQSSCEVSKDEIIADQLEIPSSALPPDEKELKASEHEHETIIDGKNREDENLKEVKEPTDEASEYVFVARSVEETCLQKEEPSERKVPEANESEEAKETFETVPESDSQSINVVSKHDSIADQTLSDEITDKPLAIPSYTSNLKENEEVKEDATELALEKLDADGTEEVTKSSEVTPKSDLQSIDVVIKDEIVTDQVLREGIIEEQLLTQSSTLLPEEKELRKTEHEHETETHDKNLQEECPKETEVTADKYTGDVVVPSSEAKTHLLKEEAGELKVSELSPESAGEGEKDITATFESTDAVSKEDTIAEQTLHQHDEQLQIASPTLLPKEKEEATVHKEELQNSQVLELSLKSETEEETKEAFETAPQVSSESIGELATDEIVEQIPPSLISEEKSCENTTTIINTGDETMNVVETPNDESRKDTDSAEETSILNVSDFEFPSSQYKERDSSNEEKNLEVATSDLKAEDSCQTTIEANQTTKIEVQNEEIKDGKEVANDSQLISVGEEYMRESQREYESREEKCPEEKNDKFTAPTEYHHEVPEVDEIGSLSRDSEKEVKPDNKGSKDHIPDEAEGMIQETAFHLGLENQGDGINCESSATEVTYPVEKDSSVEISQGVLGVEEANGTTQDNKQLEKESHATDIPSSKDEALNFVQAPKLEDTKPNNDTLVARESKEEKFCESGTETVDSTSAQISSSERPMEESTKVKVVTHLTEEKEPIVGKELQADEDKEEEEHENVEEAKTDEEKEDTEHKRAYQGYDEPVIVEASRDNEVKVSPKKSHNILSGMGKSVKHSISKVKKAIIGKSSNSKTQSEK